MARVFDPYDYAWHEDPYPTYAWLREEAPLYRNDALGFWALSRHEDVLNGFRDADTFSSADGVSLDPAATGPHASKVMSFLAMDDPRHFRMRQLVSKGFTPRRVRELEERVREITREHLDTALSSDSFDFIDDLAAKVPMDVVSELLGVPPQDRAELRRLADLVVHREDGVLDVPPVAADASLQLIVYYLELIAERRRQRRGDLTSALLDVELDGEHLTDDELCAFLFLMVVAGNETTTKLLGNAWFWAHEHQAAHQRVLNDPHAVPLWVDETLRYDASSQVLARTATRDVPVHDGVIPAGGRVLLLVGSGNRDPRVFPDPDAYDLDRDTSALLSFGNGGHFCLGASLARLEARVVLEELLGKVAGWELDTERSPRVHSVNVRGFAHLPTTVVRR
ncbi:MAG TPA: cytochrome P450 [Mycobacteriales bacterium]|nr:cytochrome P450 [Mycobacteriales bacterium]